MNVMLLCLYLVILKFYDFILDFNSYYLILLLTQGFLLNKKKNDVFIFSIIIY